VSSGGPDAVKGFPPPSSRFDQCPKVVISATLRQSRPLRPMAVNPVDDITLIVCRLIVVKAEPWECACSYHQSAVWRVPEKSTRRARTVTGGLGRAGRTTSELRRWSGARGAERSSREHRQAGQGAVGAVARVVQRSALSSLKAATPRRVEVFPTGVRGYRPDWVVTKMDVCPSPA